MIQSSSRESLCTIWMITSSATWATWRSHLAPTTPNLSVSYVLTTEWGIILYSIHYLPSLYTLYLTLHPIRHQEVSFRHRGRKGGQWVSPREDRRAERQGSLAGPWQDHDSPQEHQVVPLFNVWTLPHYNALREVHIKNLNTLPTLQVRSHIIISF
jgi:hypothetical protein